MFPASFRKRLIVLFAFILCVAIAAIKFGPAGRANSAPATVGPVISAIDVATVATDVDGDGRADPGDTLLYTVTITNTGTDATGVKYTDTLDPNLTLGTVTVSPLAFNDSYSTGNNTPLTVTAPGVLGNDTVNSAPIVSYGKTTGLEQTTIGASTPTSQVGGTISLNADGNFTYTPAATFVGIDTFKYKLANSAGGSIATVSITVTCPTITVTNPATTTGTVDAAFSQTFTQSGGIGTITWSKTGALPAGITLNSATGVLSGTPTVTGSFPITVTATDSNNCTGTSATYTLVIGCQTITVIKPATATGTVDAAFSQTFTQTAAHGTATFTTASTLPSGLSLSTAGVLSGTPTQPGSFPIVVTVTDSNNCTGTSSTYNLVIACQTITVTKPATTAAVFNTPFSQTFTQSGVGTHTPITWSETGTLPNGMTFHTTTGVLDGTPTQTGTFPITVTATDANGCTGTSSTYTLTVAPQANADSYSNLVDNTQFVVAGGTTTTPSTPAFATNGNASFRLINNDLPSGGVTLTTGTFGTTAGGSVTIAADGTFIYTPAVHTNAITSDTFSYTISSNTGGTATAVTAIGTATLNMVGRVWYVNSSGSNGNGQSQSPFNTMTGADTSSIANDYVFVHTGGATTTGSISLLAGQTLWGQGTTFTLGALTIASGTKPTLTGTVTLGGNNDTVSSLDISTGSSTGITNSGTITGGLVQNNVTVTTTTGTGVSFANVAGTFTFTGLTTNGGTGANLTGSNGSAAFNFSNVAISIPSGSNPGFVATGGGTLNITGAANTLTSTTGTALNVANTTIGASGLTFQKISSNGAATGIILNNTGALGGLTVSGNGGLCDSTHTTVSDCTGGTIQAASSRGIELTSTRNITLNEMYLKNDGTTAIAQSGGTCNPDVGAGDNTACNAALYLNGVTTVSLDRMYLDGGSGAVGTSRDNGINANGVNGFTMTNSEVRNFWANQKDAANIQNPSGIWNIGNTFASPMPVTFDNNRESHNWFITSNTGTPTITFTNTTISNSPLSATGNASGITGLARAGSTVNITADHCTFSSIVSNAVNLGPTAGGTMTAVFSNNTATQVDTIQMSSTGNNSTMTYTITGNTITTQASTGHSAIVVGRGSVSPNGTSMTETGVVTNNTITVNSSTCSTCVGISVNSEGASGHSATTVSNNTISGNIFNGINVVANAGAQEMNLKMHGNTLSTTQTPANTGYGIDIVSGGAGSDTNCLFMDFGDMSVGHGTAANQNHVNGSWTNGSANKISLAIFDNSHLNLLNYSGATDAAAGAYVGASNVGGADAAHIGSNQFGSSQCGSPLPAIPNDLSATAKLEYLPGANSVMGTTAEIELPADEGAANIIHGFDGKLTFVTGNSGESRVESGESKEIATETDALQRDPLPVKAQGFDGKLSFVDASYHSTLESSMFKVQSSRSDANAQWPDSNNSEFQVSGSESANNGELAGTAAVQSPTYTESSPTYDNKSAAYDDKSAAYDNKSAANDDKSATYSDKLAAFVSQIGNMISPTVYSQGITKTPRSQSPNGATPTITVDNGGAGYMLPAGKSITITYRATVNTPGAGVPAFTQVSDQGTVTGTNFTLVNGVSTTPNTDDVAGAPVNPTVTQIDNTTVSVVSSVNPSTVGQSVTFTATMTGVPSRASDPPGTVTFFDNGVALGSPVPVVVGTVGDNVSTAVFTTSTLASGNHPITAQYSGGGSGATGYNANFSTLTGNPQVVNAAGPAAATVQFSTASETVLETAGTFSIPVTLTGTPSNTVITFASGFTGPVGLAFDAAGNLYVANNGNGTVSKVTPAGVVSTFASGFSSPVGLAFDAAGNLYVANNGGTTVSKVTPAGVVSTFASGFSRPVGLAFDAAGNLYVANQSDGTVSKVTPAGVISTFASGFSNPLGLAFDAAGNLYVANAGTTVSKVTPAGVVSTFASGFSGPVGLAFDAAGNLYVANLNANTVSKVTPAGVVSTFASGFSTPIGLAFDAAGNLYVANDGNNTVSKVSGTVTVPFTLGGTAVSGTDYSGVTASPLTFGIGQTTQNITGTLIDDGSPDGVKTLTFTLGTPTNATLGSPSVNTLTIAEPAPPQTFVVTKTADTNDGVCDADCSLREAITAANATPAADTITFNIPVATDPGCNAGAGPCTITLGGTQLAITNGLTITGPGANLLTVSGNNASRVFNNNSGVTSNITNLTITAGNANGPNGGGIYNDGTLNLTNSTVSNNSAIGASQIQTLGSTASSGNGGGILNSGTLTLTGVTVSSSTSNAGTIAVALPVKVDSAVTASLGGSGGGVYNAGTIILTNSTISGNSSSGGAGSVLGNTGEQNSTVACNSAGSGGVGGGISNNGGTLTISNSTLSNNSVTGSDNRGGGIYNDGSGTITIANSTLASNLVCGGNNLGGGVYNNGGALNIVSSSLSSNSASAGAGSSGGGVLSTGGTFNVRNTIIAGNTAMLGPDFNGSFTSQGHNLVGNNSGANFTAGAGDLVGTQASPVDPNLGPLQNNGGPTKTMALLPGSVGIDAGDDCVADAAHCGDANLQQLTTDQRGNGFLRKLGAHVDIGAFEVQAPVTFTWTGATNSNWNTTTNWSSGVVPTSGSAVDIPASGVTNEPTISATDVTIASVSESNPRVLTINSGRLWTVTGACTINGTMNVAGAFTCGSLTSNGTVSFNGTAAQNIPAGTYTNLTVNNAAGVNMPGNVVVTGVLTMTSGNINTGANTLTIGPLGSISRTSGFVLGNLQKQFGGSLLLPPAQTPAVPAVVFVYPVGTAAGYAPVNVSVTGGTGSLTIAAVDGIHPNLPDQTNAVKRYWTLTGVGITADLTFFYNNPPDVLGTESTFKLFKINSGVAVQQSTAVIDTTTHTASITGVSSFSDWAIGAPLGTTAANVTLSGKVVNRTGRGVAFSRVSLEDPDGNVIYVVTNPFGYYTFYGVRSGRSYIVSVTDKRYKFASQPVTITDDLGGFNFTPEP